MITGKTLKSLRVKRKMTQSELCHGIISRAALSRIENGSAEPTNEIMTHLLERMNYDIHDFWQESVNLSDHNRFYKQLKKATRGLLNSKELTQLYDYADKTKNHSNKFFHFYLLVKIHLHKHYPKIIPTIDQYDKDKIKHYFSELYCPTGYYDLQLIADYAVHFSSLDEIKCLTHRLPNFLEFEYGVDSNLYIKEIHKIYNNFTDFALHSEDLTFAEKLIKQHEIFSVHHPETRHMIFCKLNFYVLNFKKTKNSKYIEKMYAIADCFENINDQKTAATIRHQIDMLKTNTNYTSADIIVPN